MQLEVRFQSLDSSEPLREHTSRRVQFHLDRFGHELVSVVVRLADVNGPKGGVDKRCRITVRGARVGSLTVEERSADAYSAVDCAVGRIGRTVGRELARARNARGDGVSFRRAS